MLDIKFIRENPDAVRENIKKKFQDAKLPLVDEVLDLDSKRRAAIAEADQLRSNRNTLSKQIGMLMGQAKKDPAKLAEAEAAGEGTGGPLGRAGETGDGAGGKAPSQYAADPPDDRFLRAHRQG
mgnify:CR=1 FL=1